MSRAGLDRHPENHSHLGQENRLLLGILARETGTHA
jgi:hypothetical protein